MNGFWRIEGLGDLVLVSQNGYKAVCKLCDKEYRQGKSVINHLVSKHGKSQHELHVLWMKAAEAKNTQLEQALKDKSENWREKFEKLGIISKDERPTMNLKNSVMDAGHILNFGDKRNE